MKLEKTSAIAEIVSSLAIVATLAYLVVQTREMSNQTYQMAIQTEQTNLALNANTQATVMFADLNYLLSGLEYPELIPGASLELSEADEGRIIALTAALVRTREFLLSQRQAGLVDEATWNAYLAVLVSSIESSPAYRRAWEGLSDVTNPELVKEVEARLAK